MQLAWNTKKNKMSDIKGLQMEQDREGKIRNEDIDSKRTKRNFDFIESEDNLYHRVKKRVALLKATGSRVQTNSVVTYSNILTVPAETAAEWGEEKTDKYFEACKDYFVERWGVENVVSAKVHKDETTPHMHLHFLPVNKENGKLQARVVMKRNTIYEIHAQLPVYLQQRGFDVTRAEGKTSERGNIDDVHAYKVFMQKTKEQIAALNNERALNNRNKDILTEWEKDLNLKTNSWNANQAQRNQKLEDDTNRLETLKQELIKHQSTYEQMQLNIQTLAKQQKKLEENKRELEDVIRAKTLSYNVLAGDYTKLEEVYLAKQSEHSLLLQNYYEDNEKFIQLLEDYGEWSKRYEELITAQGNLVDANKALSEENATMTANLSEITNKYQTKQTDLNALTGQYNTLEDKHKSLYAKIRGEALVSVLNKVRELTYSTEHGDELFRMAVSRNDFELSRHILFSHPGSKLIRNTRPVFQHIGDQIQEEINITKDIQDDGPSFG